MYLPLFQHNGNIDLTMACIFFSDLKFQQSNISNVDMF